MRKTSAFTLVELLVVISIIAVLIAILLPSLNKARDHAQTVVCASNLRQIGIACQAYAVESKGCIVPVAIHRPGTAERQEMWATLLVARGYLPAPIVTDSAAPRATGSVFFCPSGNADTNTTIYPTSVRDAGRSAIRQPANSGTPSVLLNGFVDVWYGLNGATGNSTAFWEGPTSLPGRGLPWEGSSSYQPARLSMFRKSSQVAFIFDGIFTNPTLKSAVTPPAFRIGGRHGQIDTNPLTNVLFLDGHVEILPRKNMPTSAAHFQLNQLRYFSHPYWRVEQ